jgi:alpha-tubulin suppressor-like RCC1 family protein
MNHQRPIAATLGGSRVVLAVGVLALLSVTGCGSALPAPSGSPIATSTSAPTSAVGPTTAAPARSSAAEPSASTVPSAPVASASPSLTATLAPTNTVGPTGSTAVQTPSPSVPPAITTAIAVTAGSVHTCVLTSGGGVKCWGNNSLGQLGNGATTGGNTPVDVVGLTSGVIAVAAGGSATCAITSGGGLKCWGDNTYGQLGTGSTAGSRTPVDVKGLTSGVKAVAVGLLSACAITTRGGVKCWGYNKSGALGNGSTIDSRTPVDVSSLASGVKAVAVGQSYTCALTTRGGVQCWGFWVDPNNILGNPRHVAPVAFAGLTSGVAAIAVPDNICALMSGGGLRCEGDNSYGQLADGTTTQRTTLVDVVSLRGRVAAIAAGVNSFCAITSGGGVKCWGDNFAGQLGNGSTKQSSTPVDVVGLTNRVAAIAMGDGHTCVLMVTGGVKCWGGYYASGGLLLGNGMTAGSLTPVDVTLNGNGP